MNRHVKPLVYAGLFGIGISLAANILRGHVGEVLANLPKFLLFSGSLGVIWGASFYFLCVLPLMWLRTRLTDYPVLVNYAMTGAAGAVLSSFACLVGVLLSMTLPGVSIWLPLSLPLLILFDAFLGAFLALVFTGFELVKAFTRSREQQDKAAVAMRAQVLQAQINPHFFFNTLNTISSQIESRPVEAKELVARLADLFRYSLTCTQQPLVPFEKELGFVQDYLAIEQARFRERLRVQLQQGAAPNVQVPGLTLQPVVENAVRYGVAPCVEGGDILITFEERADAVHVIVRNRGCEVPDLREAQVFREGHALANIRDRLKLLFGERGSFTLESEPGNWVRATLTVPRT